MPVNSFRNVQSKVRYFTVWNPPPCVAKSVTVVIQWRIHINVVFLIELDTKILFLQSRFRISISNTFGHTDGPQARKYRKLGSDTFYLFELDFGKRDFLLVAVLDFFFDK